MAWVFGIVLGWFLWHVESPVVGDGLFHEARVRKLVDLTSLHLRTVDEFKDGGLHPGYAFPLWHGFLALVSWFSGLDPEQVVRHEPSLLAPLACVLVFEAGVAVFGSRSARASPCSWRSSRSSASAPGHGGAYAVLSLPATVSRQLMVPAAIALFFVARTWRGYAAVAAIFGALTLTHPTYSVFLLVPLLAVALLALARVARRGGADRARSALAAAARRRDRLAQSERRASRRAASHTTGRSSSSRATATSGSRPRSSDAAAPSRWRRLLLLPLLGSRAAPPLGGVRARRHADRPAR